MVLTGTGAIIRRYTGVHPLGSIPVHPFIGAVAQEFPPAFITAVLIGIAVISLW